MISRRKFIGAAGGAAGAAALGGSAWVSLVRNSVEESAGSATATTTSTATTTTTTRGTRVTSLENRVLVVLEMAGGNDALNTLVPADGSYRDARPALAIAEDRLVELTGSGSRLHPALESLVPMWEGGSMAAIAGVGMTDQTRSHFKAMDTWWSAVPGGTSQTGWLGRWLDATLEGDSDPLRAIALGGSGRALVGLESVVTVVFSPQTFRLLTLPGVDRDALVEAFLATSEPLAATPELAAAQAAIPSTIDAIELLEQASGDRRGDYFGSAAPSGGGSASDLLQTAAGIIDLDIGTKVITVGISGFDTHARQVDRHDQLLADVGAGIAGFFDRIGADGNIDDVMMMTTTEFGRRVAENGSGGTDHGNGGLQFLFGPTVQGGTIHGGFDLANLDQGDLATVVDTRSVYAVALDWLGGPTDELLDGTHDRLGLVA